MQEETIVSEGIGEGYPLSPMQKRVWQLQDETASRNAYRALCTILVEGQLDQQMFQRAIRDVIDRHEILRTAFPQRDGDKFPLQVVAASGRPAWRRIDLLGLDSQEQRAKIEALWQEERQQPFDFNSTSLLRLSLLALSAERHVLLVSLPSLCADARTLDNLAGQISLSYAALAGESAAEVRDEAVQYVQFSQWQNELIDDETASEGEAYWRKRDLSALYTLALPFESDPGAETDYAPALSVLRFDEQVAGGVETVARRYRTSVATVLHACWQTLLWRLTEQPEIVVGNFYDGRSFEELRDALGLFSRWLPVQCRFYGHLRFDEILEQVNESVSEAYDWQDHFNTHDGAKSTGGEYPAFGFEFGEQPRQHFGAGVAFSIERQEVCLERFKLKLTCRYAPGSLHAEFHYDPLFYSQAEVSLLADNLQTLLASAVSNPVETVQRLPLVSAEHRKRLVEEWNATATEYPHAASLPQLFEQQAQQTPDALALTFNHEHLSYAELNRRANRLAHHLRELGVGAETTVALCLDRSIEMVVALLAILKAGGAYVPLDPQYPLERLRFILDDAAVSVLLTSDALLDLLPTHWAQVVSVDSDADTINAQPETNPTSDVSAENLAYILYTSGSTGTPKGVCVTHRNVVRLVRGQEYVRFDGEQVFAQLAPLSFDASTFELWGSLLNGGRLVVCAPGVPTLQELREVIEGEGVTTLWLTAGLFHLLVDEGVEALSGVRQMLAGGDVVSAVHARKFLAAAGARSGDDSQVRMVNGYGPTESTTFACCHVMTGVEEVGAVVPIGRPIGNTQAYVLDERMELVAVGVTGELYLGGDGLARGYLHAAEMTAERFVPHPYAGTEGARLYRTGDLVRYRGDGELEFLGRADQQVKVRGFRIELGEIEAVLSLHPDVGENVVVAREELPGQKQLVAYLVGTHGRVPALEDVRGFVRERLPEYMLPAAFVILESLPLTPHGKVDRRALPAPDEASRAASVQAYVAPRTPIEEVIAGIWGGLLGMSQVGVHSNFFDLGGHSLMATQVIARVRESLSVELSVRQLFESPTVAELSPVIEAILRDNSGGTVIPPLTLANRDVPFPLSFAQQRLWFLDQLEPHSSAYNIPVALRLTGTLDIAALERSLSEIVRRHEALRTTFHLVGSLPMQQVEAMKPVPLPVIDLSHLPLTEREQRAQQLAAEEAETPFDLSTGPLLRTQLLKLGDAEHVALLTMHHIISDGWSMGVLVREVGTLYEAFAAGAESPLPELTIQYADYAVWQREWLQGEVLDEQLGYWREQLAGAPAVLELPTDHPRPRVQSYRGAEQPFLFDQTLSRQLKELCQQEGVTLFMLLLAAWQVLLARYSGQGDVSVGTPIAGRTHAETESLIGFFVNTLVLRTDLTGNPTFREVLKQAREVCLGAYAHQDVPFEKLVEELQPERDMSHSPLFQIMLILQNAPAEALALSALEVRGMEAAAGAGVAAKFDLTLSVVETGEGLGGTLAYNTDLFDAATIERMTRHLGVLLAGIVEQPEERIERLPLMTSAERQQVLGEWNATGREYTGTHLLHELFEEQVARTPEATALIFDEERLSYNELNVRANQLAHQLQELGVAPEVMVGVLMERSVEMVVALFAVLKAGGAYLPLDPTYPAERLRFMAEDAASPVILTQSALAALLPPSTAHIIFLDSGETVAELDTRSRTNPQTDVLSDSPAYVIYTSGSTGQPKGVVVPHRGICNRLLWMQEAFQLEASDRVLQKTPFSFDVSVWEFFWPLMTGACLVVAQPGGHQDPHYLAQVIEAQEVTTLHFVPSMLDAFLEEDGVGERCRKVRRVICSGEALGAESARRFVAQLGQTGLFNLYGPTEASVDVTWWRCEHVEELRSVPIGRPIANTQTYVLDEQMQLVAVGIAGELYLGGVGLARGYLSRAELTAEKFIPNPFGEQAGARLYRTGDLVRYRADGDIEFIGRIDHQVKIRGFRIELGEIEGALRESSGVKECAVVARDDPRGGQQLVAYLVMGDTAATTTTELRQHLRTRLPDYMVPQAFVTLAHLPLTTSGKVDRRALPAPDDTARAGTSATFSAPRTPTEEIVAGLWSGVLGVSRVGAEDNFFELGGHSLLATQVIARIREAFRVEVPLRTVFEQPTVRGLAAAVEEQQRAGGQLERRPLAPVGREGALPLSFAQQRLWFLDQLEPHSTAYNMPAALRLTGALNIAALEGSLSEIVRRHEALRTTFAAEDGEPTQIIHPAQAVELPVFDLSHLPTAEREERAQQLVAEEAMRPFDLTAGPLLRASLIQLSTDEYIALLTMHHIISDGWSMGVLIKEVGILYEAYVAGAESPLTELPIQYADYAVWQREWLQGEVLDEQLGYWREQLSGAPAVLELPTDHPRPRVQSYGGAAQSFVLGAELSRSLKELSRQEGVTLFMLLLAAWQVLLARYSGQSDVSVGTPIAGRTHAETEDLIGFFVNTLVLRTDLSGDPTFREALRQVREVCLGAYAHQGVPFEKLVEELQPERDMSRSPLFQAAFNFQNTPQSELEITDLRLSAVETDSRIAKFDLLLGIVETGEGLAGALEYRTDLFEASTIQRMFQHFENLLRAASETPEEHVSRLALLDETEREQLLMQGNETEQHYLGKGKELPSTSKGKLDRRALSASEQARAEDTAPRTSTEELVAGIYAEVLQLKEVKVEDNFFELGGHSLLATQVMSRLRKTFNIELPLRTLFEHPTVSRIAAQVEETISAGLSLAAPPIIRTSRDGSIPLSFAQQRLWFIDQLKPGSTVYNIPTAVRLSGELSLDALARTLSEVVRRHEALRTTFAVEEGEPVQVINPAQAVELPLFDLSELPPSEREERAQQLVAEEASKPFDLSAGLLLRAAVIRLSADDHIALLTMHHIISDGWSMGVLVREVGTLYEAFMAGAESPLPELSVQYADYAVWQREWLAGEVLDEQLGYWREQLQGAPAVLELPTDHPRAKEQRHRGAHYGFTLEPEVARGLKELSQRKSVTLFMTLLAAWQVLLARYSGQTDIVVGADVANRHRGETEGLIGFFVNMLVLRTDLSGAPTFSELLGRVREVCLGAYAHQDMPFERLVEELQPERDMSRSPLFQVLFVLQNTPVSNLELTELTLHQTESRDESAKFDLTLSMEEIGGTLSGTLGYDTDLFEAETIGRMVEHFRTLLEGIISSPEQSIHQLPLLTTDERQQQLEQWNATATEYPHAASLPQLFEQQAQQTPDALALTFNHEHLSYSELNRRANRLAHHLRELGVGAETTVGLCLDRSVEMVVALLAILKAGGAYVPLDPQYPLERLRFILDDAAVSVLLTSDALLDLLPTHWAQVVSVDSDDDAAAISTQPETNPTSSVTAENLAYILYTSGSTGTPKGVCVTHRNVVRLVRGQEYVNFDNTQVFAQLAPLSFDASTFELWGSLLNGGRLVVCAPGVPTLQELREVIEGEGVTTLWLTAGLFHLLVDEGVEALSGVRQMLAGGDVVSAVHARKFLAAAGAGARLVNGYGPTESTTFACCHVMTGAEEVGAVVPIGRPIGNTQAYVLDERMELVAVGVTGELYLGGDGLARGYLNEAGLTAARFVPHPYAAAGGERLYRTGDLVGYNAHGEIVFLGRADQQVKVRGFRIELGEIEATVMQLGEVKEAVVVARGDDAGNKVLVCYVVMPERDAEQINHLRHYLKERLPEYMVPQVFVQLAEMPLTTNGKIDRSALPDPDQSRPELVANYVAPRNPTEETLASMWAEVLKVERVGVEDDFFDLGGHSLLATQIISRVRETFKVEVPLRNLFESPTVAALAELLDKADTLLEPQAPEIVPVTRHARRVKRPRTGTHT